MSVATVKACRLLPVAITAETSSAPSIVRLAAKLLSHTPGQSRLPHRRSAARAMPDGGQIAVA